MDQKTNNQLIDQPGLQLIDYLPINRLIDDYKI